MSGSSSIMRIRFTGNLAWGSSGESVQQEGQDREGRGKNNAECGESADVAEKRREEKRRERQAGTNYRTPTGGNRLEGGLGNKEIEDGGAGCDRRNINSTLRGLGEELAGMRVEATRQTR